MEKTGWTGYNLATAEGQQAQLDEINAKRKAQNGEGLEVGADALPLDFLMAVFRDADQPMNRRVKCAEMAAPYVHPKLALVATANANADFGVMLERAIEASTKARESPKMIEAQAKPTNGHSLSPTDVSSLRRRRA